MLKIEIKIVSSRMASLQAGLTLSRNIESTGESWELDARLLREIGIGTRGLGLMWERNMSPVDDLVGRVRSPGMPFYASILEDAPDGGRNVEGRIEVTLTEVRGPGRPRIGLVRREIKVTPEQDDWLSAQPGGASAAIRQLIDQARAAE